MDQYIVHIQPLLLKKEKEYGKLCQITSRITQENIIYIDSIRDEIANVCKSLDIPIEENNLQENPHCISIFKFLSLNTNFKCLELLAQDYTNTHLVDICPLLSPYLFVEVIWKLHYEDILSECVLYVPLDFAVEIIEIARSCIDMLHSERALRFVSSLIKNSYKKLILIDKTGTQSTNIDVNLASLVNNIQELFLIFPKDYCIMPKESTESENYNRLGIVMKSVLDIVIYCLELRKTELEICPALEKLYKVTFGHESVVMCDETQFNGHLNILTKEMMNILHKMTQGLDCNCYIGWVEFDDIENPSMTLQRAIGLKSYALIEMMQNDEILKDNVPLITCLKHMSSTPDPEMKYAALSTKELIKGAQEENVECISELFKRYKTWDEATFDQIKKLNLPLDKNVCLRLLDYVVFLKSDPDKESFTRKAYLHVTLLMLHLDIFPFIKTILAFILRHDGSNILENPSTEICFKDFVDRHPDLNTEKDYKQSHLFILRNPKKYMKLFTQVFLHHSAFEDIHLPYKDYVHFSPYMTIKDNENNYLVLSVLRDIFLENTQPIQLRTLHDILTVIVVSTEIKKHDLVNMFFTPYLLSNNYPQTDLMMILHEIKFLWRGINYAKVDMKSFFQGITKKLHLARKDTVNYRSDNCRIINNIKDFFEMKPCRLEMRQSEKSDILMLVEPFLEPLDRCCFIDTCLNWSLSLIQNYVIYDYERRFYAAKYKVMNSDKISPELKSHFANFGLLAEDFIRHAIIRSISKEYISEGISIMKGDWKFYKWNNLHDSFAQFCRITVEACQLCLEYPEDFAVCTFSSVLDFLVKFFRKFQTTRIIMLTEEYCSTFVKSIKSLEETIAGTPYIDLYHTMISRLDNALASEGSNNFLLCAIVEQFAFNCLHVCEEKGHRYIFNKTHNAVVTKHRYAYCIVNASMMITTTEIQDCLLRAHQCLSII